MLAVWLVALAACGSSEPATAPSAGVPSPTVRDPATLDYVVLGDSLPTGRGPGFSFADLYGSAISEQLGIPVEVDNLAVDAWTTGDLLAALTTDASVGQALSGAEIVTVSVGFNDIFGGFDAYAAGDCGGSDGEACLRADVAELRSNFAGILDAITSLDGDHPTIVRVTDDYNEYVGNPPLDHEIGPETVKVIDRYVRLINKVRCRVAADRAIPCTDIYCAFDGDGTTSPLAAGLLERRAPPFRGGQRLIAETVLVLGLAPLG